MQSSAGFCLCIVLLSLLLLPPCSRRLYQPCSLRRMKWRQRCGALNSCAAKSCSVSAVIMWQVIPYNCSSLPLQTASAASTHHHCCAVCVRVCVHTQVFVAQGKRRRAESTILESDSLMKALQQQTELDDRALKEIIQARPTQHLSVITAVRRQHASMRRLQYATKQSIYNKL